MKIGNYKFELRGFKYLASRSLDSNCFGAALYVNGKKLAECGNNGYGGPTEIYIGPKYKAFGKDPSRYRVSSEALIRRIGQGKGLYEVNTVVDVNNLISIESGFSVGSYDVSQISEELVFRIGQKGETYKGIGKDEIKIEALPVLADKDGAIGSSTSDSERAMITEDVTEVLTLIYSFSGNDDLEKALEYGRKYLEEYAGAQNLESWIVE